MLGGFFCWSRLTFAKPPLLVQHRPFEKGKKILKRMRPPGSHQVTHRRRAEQTWHFEKRTQVWQRQMGNWNFRQLNIMYSCHVLHILKWKCGWSLKGNIHKKCMKWTVPSMHTGNAESQDTICHFDQPHCPHHIVSFSATPSSCLSSPEPPPTHPPCSFRLSVWERFLCHRLQDVLYKQARFQLQRKASKGENRSFQKLEHSDYSLTLNTYLNVALQEENVIEKQEAMFPRCAKKKQFI